MTNVRTRFAIIKWIPRILILGVVAFSFYVGWSYRETKANHGEQPSRIQKPPGATPKAQQKNIDYSHFDKGKLVYKVNAETVLTMKSDQQRLKNPEFIFYDENQKEMIRVTGKNCNISPDFNQITVIEDTQVRSKEGMQVAAHMIKYDSNKQTFSTPGQARFKWRTLTGKSKGFTYNIQTEELELHENPEISYKNLASENKRPIVMNGNSGYIDRKNGFAYFEGNVLVNQGRDRIKAHRLEATFRPGGNDLEKLTAIKNVNISFGRPGKDEDQPQPSQEKAQAPVVPVSNTTAPSMGNVFSADSESGKDLIADFAEMIFYDDGNTIRSFHSTGDCTFILHTFDKANKPKENRIIKGQSFDANFNTNGDMQDFRAVDKVSVKFQPLDNPKRQQNAASQTIYCNDLFSTLVPETGDVKEIHFNEAFKHVQGTRTVKSDKAIYYGNNRKTDLIGEPEINDATFNITAQNMELFEETSGIHASGNVKSAFVKSEGKTPTTFPFSSPSNQPVYISSEDMVWDSQKSEATYTEKAKLWQDKNVISANRLIINDRDKTMSAYEKVHTIFYNNKPQKDSETETQSKKAQPQSAQSQPQTTKIFGDDNAGTGPISVDAHTMNYVEKDRIIHFEKEVKVVTETTKINSDKTDFYLKPDTSELDRLYAQGKVTINHDQKRGSGSQATFFANERKLVLEGYPRLQETGQADIVGRMLTLFLADDRILIDGQEDGRATTTLQMTGESPSSSKSADIKEGDKSGKETSNAGSKKKKGSKKRKSH
ncbi:LPS export ABC transporter periplasmic protein LptC [bacterium]|nr:LPS export ABC transporter periplasmic protein LptC [bacterium]